MSRNRMLCAGFQRDDKIIELEDKPYSQLAFMLMWTECDDNGVLKYTPKSFKANIFPASSFDCTKIEEIIKPLIDLKLIVRYSIDDCEYLAINNKGWAIHQRIDNPQPCTNPLPEGFLPYKEARKKYFNRTGSKNNTIDKTNNVIKTKNKTIDATSLRESNLKESKIKKEKEIKNPISAPISKLEKEEIETLLNNPEPVDYNSSSFRAVNSLTSQDVLNKWHAIYLREHNKKYKLKVKTISKPEHDAFNRLHIELEGDTERFEKLIIYCYNRCELFFTKEPFNISTIASNYSDIIIEYDKKQVNSAEREKRIQENKKQAAWLSWLDRRWRQESEVEYKKTDKVIDYHDWKQAQDMDALHKEFSSNGNNKQEV